MILRLGMWLNGKNAQYVENPGFDDQHYKIIIIIMTYSSGVHKGRASP